MAQINRSGWASRLHTKTHGFRRHLHVPQFWDDSGALKQMIEDMFSSFANSAEPPVLRVYVARGQRFDLEAKLVSAAVDNSISFEQWLARVIGHKRFCVTLNGLTRWNDAFHCLLHKKFVGPLLRVAGAPVGGLDSYAFIGNYGFTPFGIHDDGELSFLLHVGPEEKVAYLWPRQVFLKRGGKPTTNFDFAGLQPSAARYTLRAGDLLFIPKGVYHVLNSKGFSVTLGLTVFPATRQGEIFDSLRLLYETCAKREIFFAGQVKWGLPARKTKLRLNADMLAHQLWRSRMTLKSNGYVTTTPLELTADLNDMELERTSFQVPRDFKLYFSDTAGVLEIFIRGRELRVRSTKRLRRMLKFLNTGKRFTYAQFRELLSEEWTEPAIRQIFADLYRLRAFAKSASLRRKNEKR